MSSPTMSPQGTLLPENIQEPSLDDPQPLKPRPLRARPKPTMRPWVPESPELPESQPTVDTEEAPALPGRFQPLDLALLAFVLAVTLFIRLWDLDKVPRDVMPDEADYLNVIYRILVGDGPKFFEFTWDWSQTASNTYLQTAFVWLFGLDNTIVGLRMSAVVMSTLATIPFFLLIRRSFGRWTALLTTLLFSSGWWYLNLSRTAWINTFVVFYGLMSLWFVELALRAPWRRALLFYALGGAFASFAAYGYAAGKVLTLSIGLYVAIQWFIALWGKWRTRKKRASAGAEPELERLISNRVLQPAPNTQHSPPVTGSLHKEDPTHPAVLAPRRWRPPPPRPALVFGGGLLLVLVAVLLFLPQVPAILKYWDNYMNRPQAVSITNVQLPYEGAGTMQEVYQRQISKVFDGWVLMRGLEQLPQGVQLRYNPPSESFVDAITRGLYILGMLLSLFMLRRSLAWWLFWLLGLAVTQVLTTGIPDGARAVVIIPSVYFFVACSIYWILRLGGYLGTWRKSVIPARVVLAVVALVCAGLVVYNVRHYWDWMHMPQTAAARQPSVELDEFEEWQYVQLQQVKKKEGGFTVDHWHVLRQEQPVGLVVAYYRSPDWKGPPEWLRRGAPLALVEDSPVAGPEPFSVRWKGFLRVPSNGDYTFTCMTEGACELTLDGRKLFSLAPGAPSEGVTVTLPLASGPHAIEVLYAHRNPSLQPAFSIFWHPLLSSPTPIPIELVTPSKYTLNP